MVDALGTTIPALATFQRLMRSDGQALLTKFQSKASVQKEIDYFREKAPKLTSIDDFMKDQRLMRFVLSAYSLDDEIQYPGRLRKILESKVTDQNSLANRMRDPRYSEMARDLLFGDLGTISLSSSTLVDKIVGKYVTSEYEKDLGNQNPALREAAYFLRKIGNVKNSLDILGDGVLRQVVTYTLDLPPQIAVQSIEKQQSLIDARLDVSKFITNGQNSTVGSARSVDQASQDITTIDTNLQLASTAATQVQTVIARLQALKDDYARLTNIQNPTGPFSGEIPTQEAAAPELTRQSGLLGAAQDALDQVATHMARMDELIDLARDPANAGNLTDYKTEFADLQTKIQSAVSGATYNFDDGDADSTGTPQNLLDGSLPPAISVQIKSTGETISIRTHDLSGMLASATAANNAFQAVTGSGDAANLDAAQSSTDSANAAQDAASLTVTVDQSALQEGVASVTQWAATLNTGQLYPGYQALRDAGSRTAQINTLLGEVRSIATESASRAGGADRSDLDTRYADLVTRIGDLVNTPGAGTDNLLAGADKSYELLNGVYLQARGRDLNGSVVTPLSSGSVGTAADAQALLSALDATVAPAMTQATREIKIDTQPFGLAAGSLDPRAAIDSRYRALTEEMKSIVDGATVDKQNLLESTQSNVTVSIVTSGHTVTLGAQTGFDALVTQTLEIGADNLPTDSGDLSGAMAMLDQAMFNAKRTLSSINNDMRSLNLERGLAQAVVTAAAPSGGSSAPVPFQATDFALKFIQKYLVKKDLEAVNQNFSLADLLLPASGSGTSASLSLIAGLAGRSRVNFFA